MKTSGYISGESSAMEVVSGCCNMKRGYNVKLGCDIKLEDMNLVVM